MDKRRVTERLTLSNVSLAEFLGPEDSVLKTFESMHPKVEVFVRGNSVELSGDAESVAKAKKHFLQVAELSQTEIDLTQEQAIDQFALARETILEVRGRAIRPQTDGQAGYVSAIGQNTITFGIGPAGTGKTYLAVAKAVAALKARKVSKIILTRPAVEAGERLGYLPGTLAEKIDPYLRPLFDAAAAMLEPDAVTQLLASGAIEVAPLAYMRGRTLNESFVILDEAQNTTPDQMKMFLTRLGYGSQIVVTGDLTQADITGGVSGLSTAKRVLQDVPDIAFIELTTDDIVRHSLVGRIVEAYGAYEATLKDRARNIK